MPNANEPENFEQYLRDGCGRCDKYKTPDCKVHFWHEELTSLRAILLEVGLQENIRWSQPVYSAGGQNVVIIFAFRAYFGLGFMKGALLDDPQGLLVFSGPNSQSAKQLRFENAEEIVAQKDLIKQYLHNAIKVTKSGQRVAFDAKHNLEFPEELLERFDEDPDFHDAFMALTPGRQRGYNLFFTGAKQSATRIARIEKYYGDIMEGLGIHDRYRQGLK